MKNYIKRIYEGPGIFRSKEIKKRERRVRDFVWITIDSTRKTNTFFVASDPIKKTITQTWLGNRQMVVKRRRIKLSESTFYQSLFRFFKQLRLKLKGRKQVKTILRLEGSFRISQIKAMVKNVMRMREIKLVEIRDATALHLFSGIRFRKERRT